MARKYKQSAALPYRFEDGKLKFMLITTTNRKRWVAPKGMVDQGLTPSESAAKEAYEEAGVVGKIGQKPVGRYEYQKWGAICVVKVFTLRVKDEIEHFPEAEIRQREWLSARSAVALIEEPELREIIRRVARKLSSKKRNSARKDKGKPKA